MSRVDRIGMGGHAVLEGKNVEPRPLPVDYNGETGCRLHPSPTLDLRFHPRPEVQILYDVSIASSRLNHRHLSYLRTEAVFETAVGAGVAASVS